MNDWYSKAIKRTFDQENIKQVDISDGCLFNVVKYEARGKKKKPFFSGRGSLDDFIHRFLFSLVYDKNECSVFGSTNCTTNDLIFPLEVEGCGARSVENEETICILTLLKSLMCEVEEWPCKM